MRNHIFKINILFYNEEKKKKDKTFLTIFPLKPNLHVNFTLIKIEYRFYIIHISLSKFLSFSKKQFKKTRISKTKFIHELFFSPYATLNWCLHLEIVRVGIFRRLKRPFHSYGRSWMTLPRLL